MPRCCPARPGSFPGKPRTYALAITLPRYGSSPAPSIIRPHRGSRAMSTIGEKVHRTPEADASSAAIRAAFSTISGSHVDASPSGTGNSRPVSVNHVQPIQQGNVQPRFLHRDVLIPVRRLRIVQVEQRTHLPLRDHVLVIASSRSRARRCPRRILHQLPDLLLQRHLAEQSIHLLFNWGWSRECGSHWSATEGGCFLGTLC